MVTIVSYEEKTGFADAEYDIRGDCGSANHEPRTRDFVVQPGAIPLILEPLARPSRMLWSKT
jgi:hypothetical protein